MTRMNLFQLVGVVGVTLYALAIVWAGISAWRFSEAPLRQPLIFAAIVLLGPVSRDVSRAQLAFKAEGRSQPRDTRSLLSQIAIWVYVLSLAASISLWIARPSSTPVELQYLALSSIGVVCAPMAIVFGRRYRLSGGVISGSK